MAEVIFAEQTLEFAPLGGPYGAYTEPLTTLVVGENYTVCWDGVEHESTCKQIVNLEDENATCEVLGNAYLADGVSENSGENFVIVNIVGEALAFISAEDSTSHTVAIYASEETEQPEGTELVLAETTVFDGDLLEFGAINAGKKYIVNWDGTMHEVTAFEIAGDTETHAAIGNMYLLTEDTTQNTEEPFLMVYTPSTGATDVIVEDTSTPHTVAIYAVKEEEPEQPEETAGVSIVLYDRNGEPVTYKGVETITTDTPTAGEVATFTHGVAVENAEYELDMATGDQTVKLAKGNLLKGFTIKKPETLSPEYIKKNVKIAGIVGEFAGDEMEKTVDLAMADGEQVIEADADTVMTKVTVNKPATMLPENIKKDVKIGGITGTFVGDGQEKTVALSMTSGDQVIEADEGTVLSRVTVTKPDALVPENIKNGTDVAGVIGSLKCIVDVETEAVMDSLLIENNIGNAYRFTGETTEKYINGDIYVVEVNE